MNTKRLVLIALMPLLGWLAASAQDSTYSFTLTEAQNFAIENFFATKNAALDIEAAQKKIWETTAIGLPQVSGNVSYQHIPGKIPELDFSGMFDPVIGLIAPLYDTLGMQIPGSGNSSESGGSPIAPKNSMSYTLTVSQLVFSGEYIVGLQASKVYKMLSEESYDKAVIDVKENIAGTYYGILILEDNLKSLQKTLDNIVLTYEHTKKYHEVGLAEELDVDQLNLVVRNTENSIKSIERQTSTMYNLLRYQLGITSNNTLVLREDLQDLLLHNIVDQSKITFDLESNIDYKMLATQSDLMKLNMNRYKTQYLPTVAAFYQYTDKTNKTAVDFTINNIIGVSLSVPIFSSGQRMAVVSQKKIEFEKAQNMQEQQSIMLQLSAIQAKNDYQTALEKYENEKVNLELAEKILHQTNEKYKEGMVSIIELSQVNNQYLMAQMNYSATIQELLSAKIKLDKTHNIL